ncbi:hypothetical protein ACEV60_20075 [Enterobacter ludwigii]|uniref:hypothetical protein n=1 Tax=Enterobacter TaxID=547 RepID=UPI003BEEFEB8
MKTPIDMLHEILAQVSEGNTLLEMIYKNTQEMNEETDCAIACLIRSFDKTREMTCAYIEELARNSPPPKKKREAAMIFQMMYSMLRLQRKSFENWRIRIARTFSPMRTITIHPALWHR